MTLRFLPLSVALWTCLAAPFCSDAQAIKNLDGHTLSAAAIGHTIEAPMHENDVKCLAVALVRDGRVVCLRGFGIRNAQNAPQ